MGAHHSLEIQNTFLTNFSSLNFQNKQELPSYSEIYSSDGIRVSFSSNHVESLNNALMHSERIVIDQAIAILQTRYLDNCILLTTLEPCTLCMGSILKSRIAKVIYFLPNDNGDGISHFPVEWIYELNHFPILELIENKEIFSEWKTFFMDKR